MTDDDLTQINFRLDTEAYAKLRVIAAKEGTSMTALLREAVDRIIESRELDERLEASFKG